MLKPSIMAEIARQEFRETWRDRWTWVIAGMLALISLAISYFGMVQRGQTGLQNFDITITSLVSLVIYLVPLTALLLGYGSVSGEREQGSLALLLSLPVSAGEVIVGKFLGLSLALITAAGLGLGSSGIMILWRAGSQGWLNYVYFLITTIVLGLVFLSMGLFISVVAKRKTGAAGGAIFTWFFFTFIYDLLVLGLVLVLNKQIKATWVAGLLFVNPGDIFRLANLLHLSSLKTSLGLATILGSNPLNGEWIALLFLVWMVLPLAGAIRFLQVQDV